ncbi:MAG: hypothetical protein ROO76_01210 [Terriglobia bacterium]|jgi:predicted  nucleic acid-binding Zn-ribbon protein|nr:hypothetical protein [Terriglobia bacterium]
MTDPQEFREREALKKEVQALEQQEQELERLRAMLAPEYWPRIYAMLDRIRKEIRDAEQSLGTNRHDAA